VSLSVSEGAVVALLGSNGAGKSTLLRAVSGILRPSSGAIHFDGREITRTRPTEIVRSGVAHVMEGRRLFVSQSVEHNLVLGMWNAGLSKSAQRDRLDEIVAQFPILQSRLKNRAGELSGGQQQMLAIGRALMADPKLLVLDEPCLGLAPKMGNEVYKVLRTLREQGQSLIVVEESSRRALDFVDRACCLKLGEKVLDGDAEEMRADELLIEAYFGLKGAESP
jgi:branched-chain amino acid transport system ATP-binding protein